MEPGKMPTADYARVMEDDTALLDWLENLDRCVVVKMMNVMMMMIDYNDGRFGFVLLKNVPVEEGPVPALQVRTCPAMPCQSW